MSTKSFKLIRVIGFGTYGIVLSGLETTEGTMVAVKKSRASLRVHRTLLRHEAQILQLLRGHPAIPSLHGYGHLPHFEYLAMSLCGQSVKELAPRPRGTQLKTVIIVAQQMISALQYVHGHGLVHRDIKPDHILVALDDPARLMLVDFGMSCPRHPGPMPAHYNPEAERRGVIGTLRWASLNAHHGIHLSWRDDLESLAFVLFFLLRGKLPWQDANNDDSTVFGAMTRLRMLKTRWPGARLAEGYPVEFARFLDETRALPFEDVPPYRKYLDMFNNLSQCSELGESNNGLDWSPASSLHPDRDMRGGPATLPLPPLAAGQLVSAELVETPTIQGMYPSDELWDTFYKPAPAIPALVLKCHTDDNGRQHAKLAALRRGAVPRSHPINIIPPFLFDDVHCYVFPAAMSCIVVENTAQSINHRISDLDLQTLVRELTTANPQTLHKRDRVALAHMKKHNNFPLLVRVVPLADVHWETKRAWFDRIVTVSRLRAVDDAWAWTGTTEDSGTIADPELSDSYYGGDVADWDHRQGEREGTLTLAGVMPPGVSLAELDAAVPRIVGIC